MKKHYSNASSPVPALAVEKLGLRELTSEEKAILIKNFAPHINSLLLLQLRFS